MAPRPTRRVQRWAILLAALATASSLLTALAGSPATAKAGDAIQRLGGCLAGGGAADVLLVLDTSGSLASTDPDNARVKAAKFFVDELARVTEASGAQVDVAVAGFADAFDVYEPWHALGSGTAQVTSALDGFAGRNGGFETDYWIAADGARKYLADKAGGSTDRCQTWVWFSDGKYELDQRENADERDKYGKTKPYGPDVELTSQANADKVRDAGAADLCRQGGVADQLRTQRIITLAVGLKSNGDANFDQMRGIATGSGSCGTKTKVTPGEFILADRIGDLYLAFDKIANPGNPGSDQEHPICQGNAVCESGTHAFVLDPSITTVHIVGSADVPGFTTTLIGPSGQRLRLDPGSASEEKETAAWSARAGRLAADAIEVDLTQKRDVGWVGQWRLVFSDAEKRGQGQARSNIRLFGDLKPALTAVDGSAPGKPLELVTGTGADLTFGLVHRDGSTVDLADIASDVSFDAALEYSDGQLVPIASDVDAAALAEPVRLDLASGRPGNAALRMTLNVTTTAPDGSPGTELEPQSVDVPVLVKAPPEYPTVPGKVSFGTTDEAGKRTATLPLSGPGCAWLAQDESLTRPAEVDSVTVASEAASQSACRAGSLPLTIDVDTIGAGLASGRLTVMTLPASGAGEPVSVTVRYDLEMQNPRDEKVFLLALVLITLAGILIPVGLLYLVKWWTAKLAGTTLSVGSLTGPVGADAAFVSVGALSETELRSVFLETTNRRRVNLGSAQVDVKMGLGLTEPSYAVVAGRIAASSARPGTTRDGRTARLPLALAGHWIALLSPADPHRGPVEVVFVLTPGSTKLPELLADARSRLPDVVARLRVKAGTAPPPPAAAQVDAWGDPAGGPSGAPGAPGYGQPSSDFGGPPSAPPVPPPPPSAPGAPPAPPAPPAPGGFQEW